VIGCAGRLEEPAGSIMVQRLAVNFRCSGYVSVLQWRARSASFSPRSV